MIERFSAHAARLFQRDHLVILDNPQDRSRSFIDSAFFNAMVAHYLDSHRFTIKRLDSGKPIIQTSNKAASIFFSVSHARKYLIVFFSTAYSVGVDLELMLARTYQQRIAQRYFVSSELGVCASEFYRQWTAREAFVKAIGSGFMREIRKIRTRNCGKKLEITNGDTWEHVVEFFSLNENYLIAVCRPLRGRRAIEKIDLRRDTFNL